VGEVRGLSLAFIRMLENLRSSMHRVQQLAFFDTVTHLPNREKIRVDAPALISSGPGAFLFLDLDGFKSINDTFGHRAGDGLLKQVADRLVELCAKRKAHYGAETVAVARVGGDEFVVIVPGPKACSKAGEIAKETIDTLRRPFDLGGTQVTIGTSIGITVFPADGSLYDELLINADLAMYSAKGSGRNAFAFFSSALAEKSKARLSLETDLRSAIQNDELTVHYQPKIDCKDCKMRGVEALVRWNHPRVGSISPGEFLGIAEETGLIGEIDRFVIARSLSEIGSLIEAGADLNLAVNVSATEIEDPRFIKHIVQLLHQSQFPPNRLELEVTESIALRNPEEVSRRVAGLRQLGVTLAIDDFGSGYSNLATLARLPFDTLKLDRSLISGVTKDEEKQSILRIALGLAQELGFVSVAEGVETFEEFRFVAAEGASMAQGFFFSPAVPVTELSALLTSDLLAQLVIPRSRAPARAKSVREQLQ
jgi:diguanylate cyclase (GGDEF)-like protein